MVFFRNSSIDSSNLLSSVFILVFFSVIIKVVNHFHLLIQIRISLTEVVKNFENPSNVQEKNGLSRGKKNTVYLPGSVSAIE